MKAAMAEGCSLFCVVSTWMTASRCDHCCAQQLPVPELMEAAKLAGVPLHQEHQTLLFHTPYANRYASTWNQESPRSAYGLECSPRSVKWRAFEAALQHGRMMPQSVEAQLQKYAASDAHRSRLALSPIGPCLDRYNKAARCSERVDNESGFRTNRRFGKH